MKVITNIKDPDVQQQVGNEVRELCSRFPVPGIDD